MSGIHDQSGANESKQNCKKCKYIDIFYASVDYFFSRFVRTFWNCFKCKYKSRYYYICIYFVTFTVLKMSNKFKIINKFV